MQSFFRLSTSLINFKRGRYVFCTKSLWTLCCLVWIGGLQAKDLPEIYWNSSNPIFRIDNTEHVFVVKIHDRVDFVCPYYATTSTVDQADAEVMEIHSVSKWAYDYCALSPDSVVAGVCNNPYQRTYATVVFREYTPKPGGLEFKPGRSYYFISTSTGQAGGVQNKHGGLCSSKNLKVKFEVESINSPEVPTSKSVDGYPAAAGGGVIAETKPPLRKGSDDDGYDDQYQMVAGGGVVDPNDVEASKPNLGDSSNSGSSRTHDNSRELKKHNTSNGGVGKDLDLTTPKLYEIHTRPEGEVVDVKRTDYREHYGSNAQERRNAVKANVSDWRTLVFVLLNLCCLFKFTSS